MNKCSCYHEEHNRPECYGTKERESCSCCGDETKCNFYPYKREEAQKKLHENAWDKEEVWEAIHKLSDMRAGFSVFAKEERSVYHSLSLAIKALREVIGE